MYIHFDASKIIRKTLIYRLLIMEEIKDFVICLFDTGLQLVPKPWFVPNSLENVMFPSYKTESRIMKAVRNKETPQDSSLWDIYQVLRIMGSDGMYILKNM